MLIRSKGHFYGEFSSNMEAIMNTIVAEIMARDHQDGCQYISIVPHFIGWDNNLACEMLIKGFNSM